MWSGKLKVMQTVAKTDEKSEQPRTCPSYMAEVSEGQNTSLLPSNITHIRLPNGEVRRIRFA